MLKKAIKTTEELNFNIVPVSDGNMNFKDICEVAKKGGTKWFIVEQDNACEFENPLEQVERSCKYIVNTYKIKSQNLAFWL